MVRTSILDGSDDVRFVLDQHVKSLIFIVQGHWNNNPLVNSSWLRVDQPLLLLLRSVSLAEKQQIPIS